MWPAPEMVCGSPEEVNLYVSIIFTFISLEYFVPHTIYFDHVSPSPNVENEVSLFFFSLVMALTMQLS